MWTVTYHASLRDGESYGKKHRIISDSFADIEMACMGLEFQIPI